MNEEMKLREMRWRLLPHGTELKNVPPDWRGLTWKQYQEVWWDDMRELAKEAAKNRYSHGTACPGTAMFGEAAPGAAGPREASHGLAEQRAARRGPDADHQAESKRLKA
jgi:hypothetical protein